jgi:hypothetical protein
MAKYLPTKWSDARGRENGIIWSKNQYGLYFKNLSTPFNPNTTFQQQVRASFKWVSQNWRNLTQNEQTNWNEAAINFMQTNVFGNQFKYTGFNLYMHINKWRKEINQPITNTPPPPATPSLVTIQSISAVEATDTVQISFSATIPANHSAIIYATPPLSNGINFARKYFRKLKVLAAGAISPQDISAEYVNRFGTLTGKAGLKIFCNLRIVTNEGIIGVITQANTIIS